MRFKVDYFSRDFPYYVARESSDNLSLIESGRANQAESHAGGPTSETASGKCLSHKRKATVRTLQRHGQKKRKEIG